MLSSARGFDTRNLKNVKTAVEHVGLYVGLIIYTAVGAMVRYVSFEGPVSNAELPLFGLACA